MPSSPCIYLDVLHHGPLLACWMSRGLECHALFFPCRGRFEFGSSCLLVDHDQRISLISGAAEGQLRIIRAASKQVNVFKFIGMADSQFDSNINLDNKYDQSELNTVRRNKDRATYDKHQIADIVRQAKLCHVSFVYDHLPQCIPMIAALEETEEGDLFVYFHGEFLCKSFAHSDSLESNAIRRLALSKVCSKKELQ